MLRPVAPDDPKAVAREAAAARAVELLADPGAARAMGRAGRAYVEAEWGWQRSVAVLTGLLDPEGRMAAGATGT